MNVSDLITSVAPGTTFSDLIWDCTDDSNGTCSWNIAAEAAAWHRLLTEFVADYGHLAGERIDSGELLAWLGY